MAGFETIVRPSVVPNFRPAPTQKFITGTVANTADPEKGFAIIHGNPANQLSLSKSTSISISRNQGAERERRVDRVRVYQKLDDGTINKENFVDIEVTNRMKMRDGFGTSTKWYKRAMEGVSPGETIDNKELLLKDLIYNTKMGGDLGRG